MKLNIGNIFLLDGIGALLSFLGTGLIFPIFSSELGIPVETFYLLATFPTIYCLYSLICHFFVSQKKLWMLIFIMMLNLLYCFFSVSILFKLDEVTVLGYALILGEVSIILGVVFIEYRIFKSLK